MKSYLQILLIIALSSCASVPKEYLLNPTEVSDDPTYGYSEENPIKVGGVHHEIGPANERTYLFNLRNVHNERPQIERLGSCCPFKTANSYLGTGLLDVYQLTFNSTQDTVTLYVNMYDYEHPKAPKGFRLAGSQ